MACSGCWPGSRLFCAAMFTYRHIVWGRDHTCLYRSGRQVAVHLPAFFLPLPTEKLAEAQRRFTTLRTELQSTLDAQKEASGASTLPRRRKPVFHLSHEERVQHRNIKDLKLAFSELYLSLILLQNYQVSTEGSTLRRLCVCSSLCSCCLIQASLPLHFSLRDPGFS